MKNKPKNEQKSERIQVRCTKAEKRYWRLAIEGGLSAHIRSLLPKPNNMENYE